MGGYERREEGLIPSVSPSRSLSPPLAMLLIHPISLHCRLNELMERMMIACNTHNIGALC